MANAAAVRRRQPAAARATLRYVRGSAPKARVVLDQIRDKSYVKAAETLKFSERRIAGKVLQCLESAGANAENNKQFDTDELFVLECYADVGPSIKRWRPRARGRATPITKRTCHITVVLGRFTAEEREIMTSRSTAAQEARRRRVAASRAEAAAKEEAKAKAEEEAKAADDETEPGDDQTGHIDATDEAAAATDATDEAAEADATAATDVDPDEAADDKTGATADVTDEANATDEADVDPDEAADDKTGATVDEAAAGAPARKKAEEH